MDALVQACRGYNGKTSTEEKHEAAKHIRQLALATSQSAVAALAWDVYCLDVIKALLLGTRAGLVIGESGVDASKAAALRLAVYKCGLGLISSSDEALSEDDASKLVSSLHSELTSMVSPVDISEVVDAAMDVFESDCPNACTALELLPKGLLLLGSMGGQVDLPGDSGNVTACQVSDFCQGVLGKVCQHAWPTQSIAKVLLALRDFPLTQESLQQAVQQGVARAKSADVHDLPSIVHQLLMLSAKGCRDTVLLEVVQLFEQREAALGAGARAGEGSAVARRQLLEVEGSVLLHIDLAAKHDVELGQAWLRYLRSDAPRVSAFMLAVSFMLAAIQRFEQPVTDALKSLITGALKDAAALAASPWLPAQQAQQGAGAASGQEGAGAALGPSYPALRVALLQCVRNSAHGQGGIIQPMAQLAVALMESTGGDKGGSCYLPDGLLDGQGAAPAGLACDLGMHMLLELFRGQKEFRRDVIAICHNRLVGAKEDAAAPFVRLIALLVRQEGAQVAEYMNDFKVSLENLAFLPPNAALALLLAVWPLCRARQDVQDYLVMLLRKAMFSREVHARLLAARGFLYMIIEELKDPAVCAAGAGPSEFQAGSSSQMPSMSQMNSLSGGPGGATLLHELMGFLRRCLNQQAEVRRALYDGMPAVLAADPSAQECIVEPLLPHFCQFYETDEQLTPPLKLETCARLQGETVRVVEPLQHLLWGLRRVLRLSAELPAGATEAGTFKLGTDVSEPGGEGAVAEALRTSFQSLRARLVGCTLEDFSFDASTDFTLGQPAGELGHATADILLGCMEVMIEDLVDEISEAGAGANTDSQAADLQALFQQHQRLVDLVAEGKKGGKGKKVEGLTQAVGGRKGPGRPSAAGKAAAAGGGASGHAIDKRLPALSVGCLCKLLDAISVDNARLKLARDTQFQTFVLASALRTLQACAASDTSAAIATGTAGSEEDGDAVRELLAVPLWQELALPMFKAVQTVVLACAGQRVVIPRGEKKEKDPTEPLTQAALKALEQLLAMGRSAAGVAALLRDVPLPDDDVVRDARLPSAQGLPEAQRVIAQQLPHFKQLLDTLVEHSCGKELESLCACLQQLAGLLRGPEAACVAGWAVEACKNVPPQAQLGVATKGLVLLALRCSSLAGMDPHCEPRSQPEARDVQLLRSFADEVQAVVNNEEAEESEKYPLITDQTVKQVMAVLVSHLESQLTNLDWALAKLRMMMPSAGKEVSLRQSQVRMSWEKAAYERLRHLVEACGVMVDTRLAGPTCESLLKSCTHLYKVLGAAAKAQFAPKGTTQATPCRAFQDLVAAVNRSCTAQVYSFISDVHGQNHAENDAAVGNVEEGGDGKAVRKRARALATAANKARRESKLIPALIFQIEDYEKQLIRLSKTGKMNLMLTAKRSTNRDFKLSLKEEDSEAAEQEQGGGARPAKRAKKPPQPQPPPEEEEGAEEDAAEEGGEEEEEEGMEYE